VIEDGVDASEQLLRVLVGGAIDQRWRFDAVIAAKFTNSVVVQDGLVGWYVERATARYEFPDKVIARLDDGFGLANVLGALLLWMQLGASVQKEGFEYQIHFEPASTHRLVFF
jgi:hypothetical protein